MTDKNNAAIIRRAEKAAELFPKDEPWDTLYDALEQFTPDFMVDGRSQPQGQEREESGAEEPVDKFHLGRFINI